jgi:drug/metabolite transporter (DMT)-like permease
MLTLASRFGLSGGPSRRAEAGLLLMVLIWAVNFSVLKVGLASIEPLAFNALRFPLAALLLTSALAVLGRMGLPERRDALRIIGLGVLGHLVYQLLFIQGMALTRAGNASLVLTTSPIYTTFLSGLLRHERISARTWVGVGATVGGIVLVVGGGPGGFRFGSATVTGDLLILAGAVIWSVYTVGGRSMVRKYGSLPVTTWAIWVGAALLVLIGIPQIRTMGPVPAGAWLSVVYAGFFGIAVAQLLWYRGVRIIGSTRTSVFQNLVPIFALAVAWGWLGEVPTPLQLLGAAVIIGGVTAVRWSVRAPT